MLIVIINLITKTNIQTEKNKGIKNRIYGNAGNQVLRSSSDDTANIDIPFVLNKSLDIYKG